VGPRALHVQPAYPKRRLWPWVVGAGFLLVLGIWELRIDYGPGYRVYYAQSGPATLLVLWGGDKTTQPADIRQAQTYQNMAEDHTCKGVGECHPYREFEGMQPSR